MSLAMTLALRAHSSDGDSDDCYRSESTSLRAVVGVTCALSMVGASLIILSYCLIPDIRTKGREILLNLSLMDFVAAASNCTGIAVDFQRYLGGNGDPNSNSSNSSSDSINGVMNRLCMAQAVFAQYSTVSSILWTVCLAVYIYLCVMMPNKRVPLRSVLVFYLLSYGLPLIVSIWYLTTGKLGFDHIGGSGWCTVKLQPGKFITPFFTNDLWVYLTIFLVPVVFVALHYHLKREVSSNEIVPPPSNNIPF